MVKSVLTSSTLCNSLQHPIPLTYVLQGADSFLRSQRVLRYSKVPAFYETRMFITAPTSACHRSLFRALFLIIGLNVFIGVPHSKSQFPPCERQPGYCTATNNRYKQTVIRAAVILVFLQLELLCYIMWYNNEIFKDPNRQKTSVLLFTSTKNLACDTMPEETTYAQLNALRFWITKGIIEIQCQRIH